jgi:GTPase SAR1 family protein
MERGSSGLAGAGQVGYEAVSLRTLRVKMVLVGSSGLGKSSLALHFRKDEFRSFFSPTVGCKYLILLQYP